MMRRPLKCLPSLVLVIFLDAKMCDPLFLTVCLVPHPSGPQPQGDLLTESVLFGCHSLLFTRLYQPGAYDSLAYINPPLAWRWAHMGKLQEFRAEATAASPQRSSSRRRHDTHAHPHPRVIDSTPYNIVRSVARPPLCIVCKVSPIAFT